MSAVLSELRGKVKARVVRLADSDSTRTRSGDAGTPVALPPHLPLSTRLCSPPTASRPLSTSVVQPHHSALHTLQHIPPTSFATQTPQTRLLTGREDPTSRPLQITRKCSKPFLTKRRRDFLRLVRTQSSRRGCSVGREDHTSSRAVETGEAEFIWKYVSVPSLLVIIVISESAQRLFKRVQTAPPAVFSSSHRLFFAQRVPRPDRSQIFLANNEIKTFQEFFKLSNLTVPSLCAHLPLFALFCRIY
jgi:hypothetical protein